MGVLAPACAACLLAMLLAGAAAPAAARKGWHNHRLEQLQTTEETAPAADVLVHGTVHTVVWDLALVPYDRVNARCGDLIQFRWSDFNSDGMAQTVALVNATSSADVLARCKEAEPLTPPTIGGEFAQELLEEGTLYFVEPSACERGQILVVTVDCGPLPPKPEGDVAANAQPDRPRGWSRGNGATAGNSKAGATAVGAPAPAPSEPVSAASLTETEVPAPAPAAGA